MGHPHHPSLVSSTFQAWRFTCPSSSRSGGIWIRNCHEDSRREGRCRPQTKRGKDDRISVMARGHIGMEETACTLWEKAWEAWAKVLILLYPPLKGLELLFSFRQ